MRLATIAGFFKQGLLDEATAKELLAGPLQPGDISTVVDDSALLNDPEALTKIDAELNDPGVCSLGYDMKG